MPLVEDCDDCSESSHYTDMRATEGPWEERCDMKSGRRKVERVKLGSDCPIGYDVGKAAAAPKAPTFRA